jgi:hypothetical protein
MQHSSYWPISWNKNLLISASIGATTPSIAGPGKRFAILVNGGERNGRPDALPWIIKIAQPPLRFEKIAGTKFHRLATADKKKYAAYYQALKQQRRLEQKWQNEDQRNLHLLINIREFLWT